MICDENSVKSLRGKDLCSEEPGEFRRINKMDGISGGRDAAFRVRARQGRENGRAAARPHRFISAQIRRITRPVCRRTGAGFPAGHAEDH
jgi:hypothetical protein